MTIVEYEKQFTKLVKYALAFVIDETGKYKRSEEGLRTQIRALVTPNIDWFEISKLVEANMKVQRCIVDDKKNKVIREHSTTEVLVA